MISNLTAFQNFVYHEDLDIVCVTETWLNDSIRDSEILPYLDKTDIKIELAVVF